MAQRVKKKETLTEDDAMEVFEEIAEVQNRAFQLGLKLKLKNHVAQGICSQHQQPRDKLLYILIEALEKRSLTWKDIADALRSPAIDLPRLSRRIERAHCTKPHSGRTRLPSVGAGGLVARDVRTAPEESRDAVKELKGSPSNSHLPSLVPPRRFSQRQNTGHHHPLEQQMTAPPTNPSISCSPPISPPSQQGRPGIGSAMTVTQKQLNPRSQFSVLPNIMPIANHQHYNVMPPTPHNTPVYYH